LFETNFRPVRQRLVRDVFIGNAWIIEQIARWRESFLFPV
jgi:hypothetical protein